MGQAALKKTYPAMNAESRKRAYAAISINFMKMRPDLKHESKEIVREERLAFIAELLDRKHPISSLTALTDSQIHFVLDRMNGQLKPRISADATAIKIIAAPHQHAEIVHLTSESQRYAFDILLKFLGWDQDYKEKYLTARWKAKSERMLTHAQAQAFMMQLLNAAAHRDLKSLGQKTGRKENKLHIPIIKQKLGIDQKGV